MEEQLIKHAETLSDDIYRYVMGTRERCEMRHMKYPDFAYQKGKIQGIREMLFAAHIDQETIDRVCPVIP